MARIICIPLYSLRAARPTYMTGRTSRMQGAFILSYIHGFAYYDVPCMLTPPQPRGQRG